MEALLLTIALLVIMLVALTALARFWPRSSARTGYRVSRGEQADDAPPVPEDDEARWRWKDV